MTTLFIFEIVKQKVEELLGIRKKKVWHEVVNRKSMPHKSQMILYKTDMGHVHVAYWNAHEKALYHHNVDFVEHKLKTVRIGLRGIVEWANLPD